MRASPPPAALCVSRSNGLRGGVDRHALDQHLATVKTAVESDLGPVFPRLQLAYADGMAEHGYQVLVRDVAVSEGTLRPGWRMLDPAEAASVRPLPLGPDGEHVFPPLEP